MVTPILQSQVINNKSDNSNSGSLRIPSRELKLY